MNPPLLHLRSSRLRRRAARLGVLCVVALALPVTAQRVASAPGAPLPSAGQRVALDLPDRLRAPQELELPLGGVMHTVELEPHSLRAPGFLLLVPGPDGRLAPVDPPPPHTVVGRVRGFPESYASGSLVDGRLELMVRLDGDERMWAVEPQGALEHAVHDRSAALDALHGEATCGSAMPAPPLRSIQALPSGKSAQLLPLVEPSPTRDVATIALDADYEFYLANGASLDAAVADVETLLAGVRTIYEDQVNISYEIATIVVRTEPDDPYVATNADELLEELRTEWNTGSLSLVTRAATHLFTHRDLDGSTVGVAYVDEMCGETRAYGLTQALRSSGLAVRVSIAAHELGHNWSAVHCDGSADCAIMCSALFLCPGGSQNLERFGTLARNAIRQKQQEVACLEPVALPGFPALTSVFPSHGRASGGETLELHGTDLPTDASLRVTLDGVEASVLAASDTLVSVSVPPGAPGTMADVRVEDASYYSELPSAFRYEVDLEIGDRVFSDFDPLEIERYYFEGLAGARISANLSPRSKGMTVGLRLVDPSERSLLDLQGKAGGSAALKSYELGETGEYRLETYVVGPSAGPYQLKTKSRPQKSIKETLAVSSSQPAPTLEFSALAGTVVQLQFQAQKPKGVFALIEGEPANLEPTLLGLSGPTGAVPIAALLEHSSKGNSVRVRLLVLPETGDYTLTLGGRGGSVGYGKASVKLKPPKRKAETLDL